MLARVPIAIFFVAAGILHFVRPEMYEAIMPEQLPAHRELVYASGVAEIAGGVAVLPRQSARWGGWFLIATLIGVFPANVNMAINHIPFGDYDTPVWALWARLPLQVVFIAWAWWYTRPERS